MRTFTFAICTAVALAITGCTNDTTTEKDEPKNTPMMSDIQGSEWTLTSIDGTAITATATPTLTIADDGRATGFNGCNRYFGPATIEGDKLTVAPLGSTRKFCGHTENELERKVNAVIGGPSEITLNGTTLVIKNDAFEMTFTKANK